MTAYQPTQQKVCERSISRFGSPPSMFGLFQKKPEVCDVLGDSITLRLTSDQTDGKYSVAEFATPGGVGQPPHTHDWHETTIKRIRQRLGLSKYQMLWITFGKGLLIGYVLALLVHR